jgi:hypothetical protein
MKIKDWLILFFLHFAFLAKGQVDSQGTSLSFRKQRTDFSKSRFVWAPQWLVSFQWGGIWAHNEQVDHLAQSHPVQLTVEYHLQNPNKDWCRNFRMATSGVSLVYLDYRSKVMGRSLALFPFLEPRLSPGFSFKVGTGLVWNSKPFSLDNSTNVMLSSPVAMVMHGQLNWRPFVRKPGLSPDRHGIQKIQLGLGLTHFSNGAYSQPNTGINLFFLSLGYWIDRGLGCYKGAPDAEPSLPKWFGFVSGAFSLVEKYPIYGPKYPVFQIQTRLGYRIGKLHAFMVGPDFMHNLAFAKEIEENPVLGTDGRTIGLAFGHELRISKRLFLNTAWGKYLYKNHQLTSDHYQRYGLRLKWTRSLYSGFYLKTHRAKAECIEFQMGWEW